MSVPFLPVLLDPRNKGAQDAISTEFTFQYNHPTAGKAGDRVFIRRKQLTPSPSVYEWWTGSVWLPTESSVALAMVPGGTYTVATTGFGNGNIYQWSVQTRDVDAAVSGYANDFLVDIHAKPSPLITQPDGVQTISRPNIVWEWDSSAGSRQARYRLAIYNSTVYGAPGFDPAVPAWWREADWIMDDYKVSSTDWFVTPKTFSIEAGKTYRVYAIFEDEDGLDGGWVPGNTFTGSLTAPTAPSVSAVINHEFGRVDLTVSSSYNLLAEDDSDFVGGIGSWHGILNANTFPTSDRAKFGTTSMKVTVGGLTYDELDAALSDYAAQDTAYSTYAAQAAAMSSPANVSRIASATGNAGLPVVAGTAYSAVASLWTGLGAKNAKIGFLWYKSDGTPSTTPLTEGTSTGLVKDTWTDVSVVAATAPGDAAFAAVRIEYTVSNVGEVLYVDGVAVAQADSVVWQAGTVDLAFVAERSRDGGETWEELWGASRDHPFVGQATTVRIYDRAAPLFFGPLMYRVFSVANAAIAPVFSTSTVVETPVATAEAWWLRDPEVIGNDCIVYVESAPRTRSSDREKFRPDGAIYPLSLRTGLPDTETITITTKTRFKSHYDGLLNLLSSGKILYLQSTMDGMGWYIDCGEDVDIEQILAQALASEVTGVRHLHSVRFTAMVVAPPEIASVALV